MRLPNSLGSPVHPFIILYIYFAEAQSPAVAPPSEGRHISDPPEAAVKGGLNEQRPWPSGVERESECQTGSGR